MTLKDLKRYSVVAKEPLNITYRGYRLFSCGAPSSGSVLLSTLKIIEGYNMSDKGLRDLNIHRLDEAIRYSYAARSYLGDPKFVKGRGAFQAAMLKPSRAATIRDKISDYHTKNVSEYDPKCLWNPATYGTSHIVAADASGMSISLTSTVNLLFGSKIMVPETGWFPFSAMVFPELTQR